MKLVSAILAGITLGIVGAIACVALGYGALAAIGAYVVFGMIGTVLAAAIRWSPPRPFAQRKRERAHDPALKLSESAVGTPRF